jgi:hypothetical protein
VEIDVLILGAGPIGLTIYQNLSKSVRSTVLSPTEPFYFKATKISNLNLDKKSQSGTLFGNSVFWGNQHEVNIDRSQQSSVFSDLPGFPFPLNDLKKFNKILAKLGWPKISNKNEFVVQLHKKLRFEERGIRFFQSLELIKTSGEFYELKVDNQIIKAKYIIFATGGLSNVYFAQKVISKYYPNLSPFNKSIGVGYSNHPKKKLGKIKFERYIKFKKFRYSYSKIKIFRGFGSGESPQVSIRLWPLESNKKNRFTFEKLATKCGYAKKFELIAYFEFPQMSSSSIRFVRKYKNQLTFEFLLSIKPALIEYYRKETSRLINVLLQDYKGAKVSTIISDNSFLLRDSNHHFGGTRMGTDFDNSVVDSFGKMHRTRGIYFAGTSVIPISRVDHPTFLSSMIAIRTVKKIESELGYLN